MPIGPSLETESEAAFSCLAWVRVASPEVWIGGRLVSWGGLGAEMGRNGAGRRRREADLVGLVAGDRAEHGLGGAFGGVDVGAEGGGGVVGGHVDGEGLWIL